MRKLTLLILLLASLHADGTFTQKESLTYENLVTGSVDLGAHYFPYGGPLVRGMNLTLRQEGDMLELSFHLNRGRPSERIEIRATNLEQIKRLLAEHGLEDALRPSTPAEMERMKIAHLFRTFYPREASSLEKSPEFLDLPLEELKAQMVSLAPRIDFSCPMELEEILPGRFRYRIVGLANDLEDVQLVHICNVDHLPSILQMGLLSAEIREQAMGEDFAAKNRRDWAVGSSDSVFARLINSDIALEEGQAALILSKDVVELGTYQYQEDLCGDRTHPKYAERLNILELAGQATDTNEVMIKDAVPPKYFTGCVVATEELRERLIQEIGGDVNGIPIEDFICTQQSTESD